MRSITFDMMVLDVVVVVGVPRMAHERVCDVWEDGVDELESLLENAAHMNLLVHHKRVGAHVAQLHYKMQYSVDPGEIPEEKNGAGNGGGKVEQQVREHDNICLDAHDGACESDVGLQQPRVEDWRNLHAL